MIPAHIEIIKSASNILLFQISNIICYNKLMIAPIIETTNNVFNILHIIENITVTLWSRCKKNVLLFYNIQSDIPFEIKSDMIKIKQILFNIMDNALKFTNEGYVYINCYITNQNNLTFDICDTGIGMTDEIIKNLFVPHSNIFVNNICGYGLGLFISHKIIKSLKGHICINSNGINCGSCINFSVPVIFLKMHKQISNKIHVLLVDPIKLRCDGKKNILEKYGYTITVLYNITDIITHDVVFDFIVYEPSYNTNINIINKLHNCNKSKRYNSYMNIKNTHNKSMSAFDIILKKTNRISFDTYLIII